MNRENQQRLQTILDKGRRMVFFGGAGVSTESGIPDFRSADGLYAQQYRYPPEQMVSHAFYEAHPEEFFDFYREKMLYLEAQPGAAHHKLAQLEDAGRLAAVITQNIDGLHQAAGSRNVLELHGSVHRNYCQSCGKLYDAAFIRQSTGVPRCDCGGGVKPDVVLYGESLDTACLQQAVAAMQAADVLMVGGTSLAVYPAAGLLQYFGGSELVILNRTPTPQDSAATLLITQPIGEVLGAMEVHPA